ncbi:hypothetical protein KIW84_014802 [Lathyrus oleraceus]|uniref:Uncharacterized protein n=1 Tax=Pisum sativum TaxID=3888 RepID=A0A9D5BNL8_PEA|nr:hypothetical protein KIW84_014802 [Pisum sativum]
MISLTEVQCLKFVVDYKHNCLWRLRFGHLNFRSLNHLITHDMDWNSYGPINKPLISYGIDEETNEVKVDAITNIPVKVVIKISGIVKVEEVMDNTSQRPQRTRVRPARLQDYKVTGDDEVTPNGELVHFSLLAGV